LPSRQPNCVAMATDLDPLGPFISQSEHYPLTDAFLLAAENPAKNVCVNHRLRHCGISSAV